MKKQLVSILIHTYNRQQLAIKAVRSALAQTYRSIEIVVTDDSDTDLLGDMIMSIGDKRIRYVKNSERIGLVFNARKALQISNGEYCLFLPNDDYLTNPFYIEDAVEIFNNNEINLIIPDCIFSYDNREVIGLSGYQGLVAGKDFIHNLWVEAHIPHCGNIFRRDTVQRLNPFYSSEILWQDIELWLQYTIYPISFS